MIKIRHQVKNRTNCRRIFNCCKIPKNSVEISKLRGKRKIPWLGLKFRGKLWSLTTSLICLCTLRCWFSKSSIRPSMINRRTYFNLLTFHLQVNFSAILTTQLTCLITFMTIKNHLTNCYFSTTDDTSIISKRLILVWSSLQYDCESAALLGTSKHNLITKQFDAAYSRLNLASDSFPLT